LSHLLPGSASGPTIAEIILYQFLDFTKDCYDVDMTKGSGETVKDVYGNEVVQKYEKLAEFYELFAKRESTRRDADAGEAPPEAYYKKMSDWAEGSI